jgi:hypothetical protein
LSETIKHELERNRPLVDRLLSDITYQSADNLVDGLTKVFLYFVHFEPKVYLIDLQLNSFYLSAFDFLKHNKNHPNFYGEPKERFYFERKYILEA